MTQFSSKKTTEKQLKEPVETIPIGCTCIPTHKDNPKSRRYFKIGCPIHTR